MSTVRRLLLVAVTLAGLLLAAPAGGASYPYETFGNAGHQAVGDCTFAADANLVRMHWAGAPITTSQVEHDWRQYYAPLGGLGFLEGYGFDGHHITGYSRISTRAEFISAANTSGVYALVLGGDHAVAVISANARSVTFVTWGTVMNVTWALWKTWRPTAQYALQWAPAGQTTIMYEPDYGNLAPTFQSVTVGSTVALAPPTLSNPTPGVTFEGWSANPQETAPLYQSGQSFAVSGNTVLWAVWSV